MFRNLFNFSILKSVGSPRSTRKPETLWSVVHVEFESDTRYADPHVVQVKKYCAHKHIGFTSRSYAPTKYEEDAEYITTFPAYHVYHGKYYYETLHAIDNPIFWFEKTFVDNKPTDSTTSNWSPFYTKN